MWVGRATVFLVGLAVILALLFGVASTALGANGKPFLLGKRNVASAVSTLVKQEPGPALRLQVGSGPPLAVNSGARIANFNADKLDGQDSTGFLQNGAVAGGDLSGSYPNPEIAADAVDSAEIATNAVGAPELNNDLQNSIDENDIARGGVGLSELASSGFGVIFDPPTIADGDCIEHFETLGLTNLGEVAIAGPQRSLDDLGSGVFTVPTVVGHEGEYVIKICNESGVSVNLPSTSFSITLIGHGGG